MASIRSLAFFVWVFVQVLLVSAQRREEVDCITFFNTSAGESTGINEIVTVDIDVSEQAAVSKELYTMFWDTKSVEAPTIGDSEFTKYFIIDDTVSGAWTVSVKANLAGLPDYNPTQEGVIKHLFLFKNLGTIGPSECRMTLTNNIIDENNQPPVPNVKDDSLTIDEDFMVNYPINNFKSVVQDTDGTSPNNQFTVTMTNPECPLETTKPPYTSGENPTEVFYQLKRNLDYDTEPGPIVCQATFQDLGTPPQSSKGTITVNIKNVADEPPEFSEKYYYTTVDSIEVTNISLTIQPSSILAIDKDTGNQNSPVTYSMTDVQADVQGTTYFGIDETTGEVTLEKDLDTPFLVDHQQVTFFLKSEDASGAYSSAVLTVNLPWKHIVCGGLHFEQAQYVAKIFHQSIGNVVKVTAISGNMDELEYSLSDGYPSNKYFNINSKSGWITVNQDNLPPEGPHQLKATATIKAAQSEHTETIVNIFVLPVPTEEVIISNSLINPTVEEGKEEKEVATINVSNLSAKVCITAAQPLEAHENFSVTKQDDTTWTLRKTGSLDYEKMQEIRMVLEAFKSDIECPEVSKEIPSNLERSQVLVLINVDDINDVAPSFDSKEVVVAYPTNEGLRRAVGPVVSVQAKDIDGPEVKYSITGDAADQFKVDEDTGDVFVVKGLDCNPKCEFNVRASDTINSNEMKVTVLPLGMDHIFTLNMDTTVSEVDKQLTQLSQKVEAQISKLYVNPTPTTTMRRGRRYKREAGVTLEVQVYSLKNGFLMSLNELNSALEEATASIKAEKFIDETVFQLEPEDTTGLTAAVAVLGTLLVLVLIAGIAFFAYKKKKGKGPSKPRPPAAPISTLGNAYHNHSYEKDGHDTQRSLGHNTNSSLNGFTSVQVHNTQNGDSPPMHRSPLAKPSDSIPLRSIDNQQQAGLRRTNPDTSDYFGSPSSALPSSFTRTTASSSPAPPPSTSSSSFPIYAEIKKPKDPKPKSTAFPSSSSSSRPEKNISRTDFSSDPIDKKPDVPAADYEEVGSSKFSALKSSPPPRRSNRHESDDDDDEDVKEWHTQGANMIRMSLARRRNRWRSR
ncbi:protocadherin Fat 4-like isoform X8 [Portunus trituberculatus]|uniref:protocadherin Fat 4-like isoform X8 n=1 Tax=Portunus trituberculatus TaxID=210409 RepID=UPI001E1CF00D|nr:protocadherin Fat 4-like isoform X8 [Portunus trituberculatus]